MGKAAKAKEKATATAEAVVPPHDATPTRTVPGFHGVLVRGLETQQVLRDSKDPARSSKLRAILGLHEFTCAISYGAALTEVNFTFLLHFFHVCIIRACVQPGIFASPVLAIALAKFVVILLCTYAGAASGAHMNPNITFATTVLGFTTVSRCFMYTVAQIIGALGGIAAARAAAGWAVANTAAELGGCGVGEVPEVGALVATMAFFQFILSVIGGVAFDDRQGALFGPIVGPVCISAAVALSIFASSKTAIMINWAECLAIGVVANDWNGSEWISFAGPTIASIVHAVLFLSVPPSQAHGKFTPPLLRGCLEDEAAQAASEGSSLMQQKGSLGGENSGLPADI
eukprot:TRINITY_DN70857_c0_g1_i1.p1 TRINITY_DN70857_c0_g1~~TRINITY_DN70857_c0_g1_i1.p1  ORF type:complete len:344 (-),score=55.02 TRINITY_DN70857_c0_g1_i1:268-1299(-)